MVVGLDTYLHFSPVARILEKLGRISVAKFSKAGVPRRSVSTQATRRERGVRALIKGAVSFTKGRLISRNLSAPDTSASPSLPPSFTLLNQLLFTENVITVITAHPLSASLCYIFLLRGEGRH